MTAFICCYTYTSTVRQNNVYKVSHCTANLEQMVLKIQSWERNPEDLLVVHTKLYPLSKISKVSKLSKITLNMVQLVGVFRPNRTTKKPWAHFMSIKISCLNEASIAHPWSSLFRSGHVLVQSLFSLRSLTPPPLPLIFVNILNVSQRVRY